MKKTLVTALAVLFLSFVSRAEVRVDRLRTESLVTPLNVEATHPRLSWVIYSDGRDVMQTAYRVIASSSPELADKCEGDLWDSGVVGSDRSVLVPYGGKPLADNTRVYWRVKCYTTAGESPWSAIGEFGTGLREETHWRGRWIGMEEASEGDVEDMHSRLSSRYLRKEFTTEGKEIKRATVHVSGLGLYELFLNGSKVGDDVLSPAPTDYRRTVLYNSYDVTGMLRGGGEANAIGVTLGNGRHYTMHQHHKPHKIVNFGYPKLRLNLIIEYADGTRQNVDSDESWRLTVRGPIRSNNEYDGEIYDARLELGDWTSPAYDDSRWTVPQRAALPYGTLRANRSPNMKVMETVRPISIRRLGDRYLIDFGRNMAGWAKLRLDGTASGDTVRIRYAEILTPDSTALDTENLRTARSTDIYVANGSEKDTWWSSRFSYHGFQFVEVTGLPDLTSDDIVAEIVYDNLPQAGSFRSSDRVLDAVYANARRGVSSNYKGMPVDCPQRDERQPWTGDHNMGAWGENFMFENATLYDKWMDDIRESQREDGCIPDVAPAFYNYYTPDMTWSSTLPVVCDMLYWQTGDTTPVARNYPAMKKWMRFIRRNYTDKRGLITADKYGDWCVPPEDKKMIHSANPARKTDGKLIATAYYYKMCGLMSQFAHILGAEDEAAEWLGDGEKVKEAFNNAFLTCRRGTSKSEKPHILCPDSIFYGNNTATANILPLAFGMVPDSLREAVVSNLVTTIVTTNGGHIPTGVIGVNWLFRCLSEAGRGDVAMMLATDTTYPSFGYQISKGATTIWELWNGDTASRKMNSRNHVMMLGDLIAWYYRDLAGISPATPGYKEILLKPDFSIAALDSVSATYETPYGPVTSSYYKTPTRVWWHVEIPCNTTATLVTPTGERKVGSGIYDLDFAIPQAPEVAENQFIYEKASFPECHASTIEELPNGDLVAAFFGGTKERNPDVVIWTARKPKGSDRWTEPQIAADGVFQLSDTLCAIAGLSGIDSATTPASAGPTGPHFKGDMATARRKACWNPVLFHHPATGELMLFYKIGTNVADWTGWLVRSADGGRTWSDREPLPAGILGPIKNKPVYSQGRLLCPSSREGDGWRAWIEYTDDLGKTWHSTGPIEADSMCNSNGTKIMPIYSIQPSILKLKDGRLQFLARSRNSRLATSYSSDNGATWSKIHLSDLPNNNSGTDAVTLGDGRHVLIYNDFATIPGTPKGPRTPLCVAVSDDDGKTWHNAVTLEDSPVSQYSYPSIIQGADGDLHAVYTFRRQRIKYVRLKL